MLVYEDINKTVWRRENIGKGEHEYIVIGKTYQGLDNIDTLTFMSSHYLTDNFYYDIELQKGIGKETSLGCVTNKVAYPLYNQNIITEIKEVMLYLLKTNTKWLDSSNLTNIEKENIKELIG